MPNRNHFGSACRRRPVALATVRVSTTPKSVTRSDPQAIQSLHKLIHDAMAGKLSLREKFTHQKRIGTIPLTFLTESERPMPNPAELLHQQLTAWSNADQETVAQKRGLNQAKNRTAIWSSHRRAISLLCDIEDALRLAAQQGHPISVFEKYIPQWTEAVFAFPNGWTEHRGPAISSASLDQLGAASSLLSAIIPEFNSEQGKDNFSAFLDALESNVKSLEERHAFLRDHSLRVIRHLRGCLDDVERFGEFRITNAIDELKNILEALDQAADGKNAFFKAAKDGVWSFFTKTSRIALLSTGIIAGGALDSAGNDFYETVVKPELPSAADSEVVDQ